MGQYVVKWENITPAALTVPTLIAGASRRIRVLSVEVGGAGATSAAQGLVMSRSATGTTPAGAITPTPIHADMAASTFTTATTWAAAPAGATNGVLLPFNALGGGFRYAPVGKQVPLEARNSEVICFKLPTGITAQACSLSVLVEED